jgi:hypothetical protein
LSFTLNAPKNKFQKSGKFSPLDLLSFPATFSPQIHHDGTIKKPRSAHQNLQNPQQNCTFPSKNKLEKRRPRNRFCGSGVIGLQTARKPNSVLDDHSSTRRITAAL